MDWEARKSLETLLASLRPNSTTAILWTLYMEEIIHIRLSHCYRVFYYLPPNTFQSDSTL